LINKEGLQPTEEFLIDTNGDGVEDSVLRTTPSYVEVSCRIEEINYIYDKYAPAR